MELTIAGSGVRKALAGAAVATAAVVIFQASEIGLADHWTHSSDSIEIERGALLMPGNGEGWDLIGHAREWDIRIIDPTRAIQDYQAAVKDDPRSARYWMDLASAYEAAGESSRAKDAFEQAKSVYPMSAEVAWHYGNFLLRQGNLPEAYEELRRSAAADPSLLPLTVSRTFRAGVSVNELLDYVLPPTPNAYLQAIDFFSLRRQDDFALTMWNRLMSLATNGEKPLQITQTFPFFDALIRDDRSDDARRVWPQALAAAGLNAELNSRQPPNDSVVWNGNFASEFVNGGLDWRWEPVPDVWIGFDSERPSTNGRSIRLEFGGGSNLELHEPAQFVPVEPGHSYHFHAYMRTQSITSDSGTAFALLDPNHPNELSKYTEALTGSHDWTPLEMDFTTGADTHFLLVQLARGASRSFDNRLGGVVWIADVELLPQAANRAAVKAGQ
jgi:Tetratricopeptide repeat